MNDLGISIGHMPGNTESPLENRFAIALDTYRARDLKSDCQIEVETRYGVFRLDVLFRSPHGRNVGIELDGRAYHEGCYDTFRDAAILETKMLTRIIRIRGSDMYRHPQQVMYVLSQMEPWAFSPRGHQVLASQVARVGHWQQWVSSHAIGANFGAPPDGTRDYEEESPDERGEKEPRWPDFVLVGDHSLTNPIITEALALMRERPRLSLRQLAALKSE